MRHHQYCIGPSYEPGLRCYVHHPWYTPLREALDRLSIWGGPDKSGVEDGHEWSSWEFDPKKTREVMRQLFRLGYRRVPPHEFFNYPEPKPVQHYGVDLRVVLNGTIKFMGTSHDDVRAQMAGLYGSELIEDLLANDYDHDIEIVGIHPL